MTATYEYAHTGRNRATLITVACIWAFLLLAVLYLEAAPWLMGLIALATLPALYDLAIARQSGVRLDDDGIHWFAGRREADVRWEAIDHFRLDTRLDFSVRASVVLHNGRKLRLPLEATPPHEEFEAALQARGLTVRRHHFSLMG